MKILFSSYVFYPSIGGIELVSSILAQEFVNLGHEVKLITQRIRNTTSSLSSLWSFTTSSNFSSIL